MPDIEQAVSDSVSAQIKAFQGHMLTIHLSLVLLILSVLTLGGFFIHMEMKSYDKALGTANAANQQLVQTMKDMQAQWVAHENERDQNDKQVQVIDRTITVHDQVAQQQVEKVTNPDNPLQIVQFDADNVLKVQAYTEPDERLGFDKPSVQGFIATKIDHDRLQQDLTDKDKQLTLEINTADSLKADLGQAKDALNQCQQVVTDYKKAAKKSKWKVFLDGAEKAVLFAGGVALGAHIP